jgi:hypothetical protein
MSDVGEIDGLGYSFRLQASGFRLQASGFRLREEQESGIQNPEFRNACFV